MPLLPWQEQITIDTFGRRADGRWAARDIVALCSRQNGKGRVSDAQELPALFLFGEPQVLHSAHEFKTSQETFRRLVEVVEGSAWLSSRVKAVSRSKGDEGIELTRSAGGGRLRFVARTEGSARGFSAERIVFDEAYALTIGQFGAQTPTLATMDNPQITYTSTPPDEKLGPMPHDAMLPSVRRRGVEGDPRVALYEWSPPRGADAADVDLWYACNPSLGYLIREEFLHDQYRAFAAAGAVAKFRTEHLGEWPPDGDEQWLVIGEDEWTAACDAPDERRGTAGSQMTGRPAFAIDMTPARSHSAIGAAGRRHDGLRHIELVDHRPGSGWVVERARELQARWNPCVWVVDPAGPAGSLIPDLEAAGIAPLVKLGAREAAQACGQLFDGIAGADVAARDVRHRGQGPLTAAVAGAVKRELAGSWAWARKGVGVDISPLVVVTEALFGLATHGHIKTATPFAMYA